MGAAGAPVLAEANARGGALELALVLVANGALADTELAEGGTFPACSGPQPATQTASAAARRPERLMRLGGPSLAKPFGAAGGLQ